MSKLVNSPAKILLADDSVTMHRAVTLGLKKEPFEVLYCDNGQDALRLTREHHPVIVLADLDMPGLTGAELCHAIKADSKLATETKVILLCGSFDQIDEKAVEKIPADARLWKPFESHVLVSMIHTLLKIAPSQAGDSTAVLERPINPTQSNLTNTLTSSSDPTAAFLADETPFNQEFTAPIKRPPPPPSTVNTNREAEMTAPLTPSQGRENLWSNDFDSLNSSPTSASLKEQTLTDMPKSNFADSPYESTNIPTDFEIVGAPREHQSSFTPNSTESFEGFGVQKPRETHNAESFSEDHIRGIIREEIQSAFNSYLKESLERRLRDILAQIERSSRS